MIDPAHVRRLALALEGAVDASAPDRLVFEAGGKGFAWSWMERVTPKAPRRPRLDVLAVRCAMARKEMLLEAAPDRFFDEDHYRGYPAILVRLDAIEADELAGLLADARAMVMAPPPKRRRPSR